MKGLMINLLDHYFEKLEIRSIFRHIYSSYSIAVQIMSRFIRTLQAVGIVLLWIFLFPANGYSAPSKSDYTPPEVQLAKKYDGGLNLDNYYVSEKYDGVRAYWTGDHLVTRSGIIINAPEWFTEYFPPTVLDGELWIGRRQFEKVSGIIRKKKPKDSDWRQIKYMIFDLPESDKSFAKRYRQYLRIATETNLDWLKPVKQTKLKTESQLFAQLKQIEAAGGEGLMLRKKDSLYLAKRNDDLLKVKSFEDAEAIVVGHQPGKGKFKGLLGALLVKDIDGKQFKIGTGFTDYQRKNPPKIGQQISYKYNGKTNSGLPRFPVFLRVRPKE